MSEKRPPTSPLDNEASSKKHRDREMSAGQSPEVDRQRGTGGTCAGSPSVAGAGAGAGARGGAGSAGTGVDLSEATIARIVEAVSERVKSDLNKEINVLRGKVFKLTTDLTQKDQLINKLTEDIVNLEDRNNEVEKRLEEIEMYSRRNSVRMHGIPELEPTEDNDGNTVRESTDNIIVKICEEIGANVFHDNIDRSHRVGRKSTEGPRPILCKFTSHKHKLAILRLKKKLEDVDTKRLFGADKIYVNEDLTKQRASVAKEARSLKKQKAIADTWTKDGVIFIKTNQNNIVRVTRFENLPIRN